MDSSLRQAAQQALEAWDSGDAEWFMRAYTVMDALRAALAEPVQEPVECEPQYANEDGWCDWVCPKPQGYLMQCCDCDLIHEVESRVAKYQPRPSEEFEVVDDPDLQVQWRMKRRDDISPKQPVQEPVAWLFTNLQSGDYDFCYCEDEHNHDREMWHKQPLYTAPPQRKWTGLTEAERIDIIDDEITKQNSEHWALAQAIEAKLKEKNE